MKVTSDLYPRLFSDSHVVDLDFSDWDDWIGALLFCDHFEVVSGDDPLPLILVRFHVVAELRVSFLHHDALQKHRRDHPGSHFQWHIDEYRIERDGTGLRCAFSGFRTDPALMIRCEHMTYERFDVVKARTAVPLAFRPGAGFFRPGVAATIDSARSKRQR